MNFDALDELARAPSRSRSRLSRERRRQPRRQLQPGAGRRVDLRHRRRRAATRSRARAARASRDRICWSSTRSIWRRTSAPSLEVMARDAQPVRGERPFVFTNLKTGEGVAEIICVDSARAAVRSVSAVGRPSAAGRRRPPRAARAGVRGAQRGGTVLAHAYAEPPLRVGRALRRRRGGVHVILASSAPGIFGGDRFEQHDRRSSPARACG